ncbi:hypothetical protein UK23_15455 [Lentzea aerocolonigenes]|uniref:Head-tail adaptor protein n=2 Tax=Lentzea aerocolonigenes TaxID=68170 RepID=A0A0F0GZP3_LENAE|nr:hypothetical protein UK23_15455 [Lentzea aerocolonigenes]
MDYGPAASRRTVRGMMQPRTSTTSSEPGRQAVTGSWWLFTLDPIAARERVEHDGRVYQVEGDPERWEPRPGRVHYETTLTHADG